MSVLAVLLACLACSGHGRRVLMTSQGPSGYHDFRDAHVSGQARTPGFDDVRGVHVRKGRSGLDDMRGGHGRRASSDDFRYAPYGDVRVYPYGDVHVSGHSRRGNSSFDDMRGGHGRGGMSEFDDEAIILAEGDRLTPSSPSRRSSGYHNFRDAHVSGHAGNGLVGFDDRRDTHVRRGRSRLDDETGGHAPTHSGFHDVRGGGHGRRGMSELEALTFRHGDGRHMPRTSQRSSGYHDVRDKYVSGDTRIRNGLMN
mmetsp:Transcript_135539/g.253285  ORF Transcript_135539/g.253285 Transcript_135539/m.253285 type:complete len:255 (-) Transcript_135539:181-945(-)